MPAAADATAQVAAHVRVVDGVVRVVVRAKPRSKREGLELVSGASGALVVRVRAPPVEGAANERIVAVLADVLGARKSDVRIARGEAARDKDVEVRGVPVDAVIARLAEAVRG